MSLTAVRAYAARRGAVAWSAIRRSVGISGTPWLRARSPSNWRQAWKLVSVKCAGALAPGRAGGCGAPPQPVARAVATAVTSSAFRCPSPIGRSIVAGDQGAPSGQSHGDGVQGQSDARSHHSAVDADVLQIVPEEQLQLTGRLRGVPPLDGPGDKVGELVMELVGECPGPRFDHALKAFL